LLVAWGLLALPAAWTCSAQAKSAGTRAPQTLKVGTQSLSLCSRKPVSYCGRLSVPLDYSSPAGPFISIAYRWYPATAGSAKGTVVPVEGGPGYPSIGSVQYAEEGAEGGYLPMYGPLLEHFNMLAVDNRGTGISAPIRCPALQEFSGPTGTALFQKTVGECGAGLNHRWKYPNGKYVHASDLFTSAPAADDLAAVIRALELHKIDLYGDS
jgi:pimeloyl-ACP methyl ester carboxylesterase